MAGQAQFGKAGFGLAAFGKGSGCRLGAEPEVRQEGCQKGKEAGKEKAGEAPSQG